MNIIIYLLIAVACLSIGIVATLSATKRNAKSQANTIIEKAKLEAEVLKNNEVLKGKETGMAIKS